MIRRCYLRELDLANLTATTQITANQVVLKPFQMSLNGAPVNADVDLNLGVPGYRYAVNFNASRVPVGPMANSFSPAYRSQAKGDLLAALNLKGEGITGPSLQKNLAGTLGLSLTNAEIQLVGPRAKALLTPIALVLGSTDLLKSPLNWLGTEVDVRAGKLNLKQFSIVSPAFIAGAAGEIPLAARLQDSPIRDWPVNFALRRSFAEKLNLAPRGDRSSDYVALPNLVKATGTLGAPETKTDKLGMLQLGARAVTALPGSVGKEASKFIGQADSLLGGRLTGAPNTNAPATNARPASKVLDLFKKKTK
jgi:hypothetical protein